MAYIIASQSVFPTNYYSQSEIIEDLLNYFDGENLNSKIIERLHHSVQVKKRHLALPKEAYRHLNNFHERNHAFIEVALSLGEKCINGLLEKSSLDAASVSQIIFTTVTGLSVPSIDAKLMNRIGFSKNIKRVPLFGLGCVAGAAGIARAADYLQGHPHESVIVLAIELCSLTFQKGDTSLANYVASGLFGDGAAAILMAGDKHPLAQKGHPRVCANESAFFPNSEHVMGWDIGHEGFKIVLSTEVPHVAEKILPEVIQAFLARQNLAIKDIDVWISHPGGPKVIAAIEKGLGLTPDALALSRESLAEIGNLSSASVLIILEKTLARRQFQAGDKGLLLSMGPGFCAEMVLLQW